MSQKVSMFDDSSVDDLKGYPDMATYFLFDLSIRTLEVTIISVNFLMTCLVSEILKYKDTSHPPSWIFKKFMSSRAGAYFFLLEEISKYVQC